VTMLTLMTPISTTRWHYVLFILLLVVTTCVNGGLQDRKSLGNIVNSLEQITGRHLIIPSTGDLRRNWDTSLDRCYNLGGQPFVPLNEEQWTKMAQISGHFKDNNKNTRLWLPIKGRDKKGRVLWIDGSIVEQSLIKEEEEAVLHNATDLCGILLNEGLIALVSCRNYAYPMI
ncbi:unnamed protein product, partial [Meganyctiphanes norvegica]